ncbi:MCP four helix bundle domain-containing protein [Arenibacter echinorum]|nr:MCP four helix bundle domain-containing protein [Arenibacter echinorum]
MHKKLTLKQRLNTGFILAIAFLLVLTSNELNRRNFSTADHTVNSVFEDRVVALEYIYRLNNLFHQKELELTSSEGTTAHNVNGNSIAELLENFSKTELTPNEGVHFELLKKNYNELQSLENGLSKTHASEEMGPSKEFSALFTKISDNLDKLSKVQLSEGRQLTYLSNKALSMNLLLSKLQVAFLIVIGLLMVLIIFHGEKPFIRMIGKDA